MQSNRTDRNSDMCSDPTRLAPHTETQLAAEMDTYLRLSYYDSCRNHFGAVFENSHQPNIKSQSKTNPSVSSVLVRFLQEDVRFGADEFQKDFAYKTTVFLFSPMTTLFDIYIQGLVFWGLIDTGSVLYSKNSNIISEQFMNDALQGEGSLFDNVADGQNPYNYSSKFQVTENELLTKNSQMHTMVGFILWICISLSVGRGDCYLFW